MTTEKFSSKTKYVKTDGWRGYSEPLYAVCGANDTGTYDDSPCPTHVCLKELKEARKALKGIPSRMIVTESSNVFCVHRYIIVKPSQVEEARKLFAEYYEKAKSETRLLYAVN